MGLYIIYLYPLRHVFSHHGPLVFIRILRHIFIWLYCLHTRPASLHCLVCLYAFSSFHSHSLTHSFVLHRGSAHFLEGNIEKAYYFHAYTPTTVMCEWLRHESPTTSLTSSSSRIAIATAQRCPFINGCVANQFVRVICTCAWCARNKKKNLK